MMNNSTEYKISVMQAYLDGKEIEYSCGNKGPWKDATSPSWEWVGCTYRIKQEGVTLPSINWDEIKDEYKWLAVDWGGDAYVYVNKPHRGHIRFLSRDDDDCFSVNAMKSFSPGNVKWEDSLVQRPE